MAIPTISFPTMEVNQDENMDFGSDMPFQDNDVDFEVESMRDASRGPSIEPIQDIMIDDLQEPVIEAAGQDDSAKSFADDEMIDEDFMEDETNEQEGDQHLGEEQHSATMFDDEDLIYEEEGEDAHVDMEFKDGDGDRADDIQDGNINDEELDLLDDEEGPAPLDEHQASIGGNNDVPSLDEDGAAATGIPNESNVESGETEIQATVEATAEEQGLQEVVQEVARPDQLSANIDNNTTIAVQSEQHLDDPTVTDDRIQQDSEAVKEVVVGTVAETSIDLGEEALPTDLDEQEATESDYDAQNLHPIKVQYDGTEFCLFPPLEGDDTFFVQDSSLAFSSCDHLLGACRDVLGESIGNDNELVLDFPELGLHLREDSVYAKQLSLSQILEVYLALRQNDHEDSIPPLHCTLRTRISLSSQYAFLLSAVTEGKCFNDIQARLGTQATARQFASGVSAAQDIPSTSFAQDDEAHVPQISEDRAEHDATKNLPDSEPGQGEEAQQEKSVVEPSAEVEEDDFESFEGSADDIDPVGSKEAAIESSIETAAYKDPVAPAQEEEPARTVAEAGDGNDPDSDGTVPGDQPSETVGPEDSHGIDVNDFALAQNHEPELETPDSDSKLTVNEETVGETEEDATHNVLGTDVVTSVFDGNTDYEAASVYHELHVGGADPAQQEDPESFVADQSSQSESGSHTVQASTNGTATPQDDVSKDAITESVPEDEFDDNLDLGTDEDLVVDDHDTLSNGQSSKRKVVDEDEFDFLDPVTPEKKKSRPS